MTTQVLSLIGKPRFKRLKDLALARHQMDSRQPGRLRCGAEEPRLRGAQGDVESNSEAGRATPHDDSDIAGGASPPQRRLQGGWPGQGEQGRSVHEATDG